MSKSTKNSFLRLALSENGVPSSKRLLGALVLLICLGCLVFLVATEGGTQAVENILQTFIIVACTLLGLGSVTNAASSIFSERKQTNDVVKSDDETASEEDE